MNRRLETRPRILCRVLNGTMRFAKQGQIASQQLISPSHGNTDQSQSQSYSLIYKVPGSPELSGDFRLLAISGHLQALIIVSNGRN